MHACAHAHTAARTHANVRTHCTLLVDTWTASEVKVPSNPGSQSNSAPLPRVAPTNPVVEELLGTTAGGGEASALGSGPIPSSHLGLGSTNTGTGQLVQVGEEKGGVGAGHRLPVQGFLCNRGVGGEHVCAGVLCACLHVLWEDWVGRLGEGSKGKTCVCVRGVLAGVNWNC